MTRTAARLSTAALFAHLARRAGIGRGFTNPLPTPSPVRDPFTNRLVPWPGPVVPRFVPRPFPVLGVPWYGGIGYYYGPAYDYNTWYMPAYDYAQVPPPARPPRTARRRSCRNCRPSGRSSSRPRRT